MYLHWGWNFHWFLEMFTEDFWVAAEEIAQKCVLLRISSIVFLPDLLDNKKLTCMQLLRAAAETSKNKVSTTKSEANLQLRK